MQTLHCICMGRRVFPFQYSLFVVLGLALLCEAGCKRQDTAATQNNQGQPQPADAHAHQAQFAGVVAEHDPAKRPLILSKPAPNRRQWIVQTLQQGYKDTGRTNAVWDKQVAGAFEAFADYSRVSTTNWPQLKDALAAVQATPCDDPMMVYMRVRYQESVQPETQTASGYERAHEAMVKSQYHPLFKFFAGLRSVQSGRTANKTGRGPAMERTMIDLEDLARDTNAPVDEVFESASMWIQHSHTKDWINFVTGDLEPILKRSYGTTERWFRFEGETEVVRAWGDRGGGWANSVTEKGWEGFAEHLDKAEGFLTNAWQMNSNNAYTAYLMMKVELGQGRGRSRMELWFNRAMALAPDDYDAAQLMGYYLEPRWHGSDATALAFARSCVTSKKYAGQVPLVLADLHRSLAKFPQMTNSPAYWRQPHVWPDIKASYDRFFALNRDAAGWRHNYARDAYDCGQYAVFLEQTKLFAYGTNYGFFGGQAQFEQMLQTASSAQK